jgi:hypothetical protein
VTVPVAARRLDDAVGLTERLLDALRPEFRAEALIFPPSDPVFGGGPCHVESCSRSARSCGLCAAHYYRWKKDGRPPLEAFAAKTDQRWARQRPNARCRAPQCGYGVLRSGLCSAHFRRWDGLGSTPKPTCVLRSNSSGKDNVPHLAALSPTANAPRARPSGPGSVPPTSAPVSSRPRTDACELLLPRRSVPTARR